MRKLRIAMDLDDTLLDFLGEYKKRFGEKAMKDSIITKNVFKLRKDKEFCENLPLIDHMDFIPEMYCTKRINSKTYTRNSIIKQGLPNRPIYQMLYQKGNKADLIKGRCDVLIDDSVFNVVSCVKAGLPALLIDRPHNQWFGPQFRIYSLEYEEILDAYRFMKQYV